MYRFVGGFINTLKPYNDDEINNKFIITQSFLENIDLLLQDLKNLQENINKQKLNDYIKGNKDIIDDDIAKYIKFCNTKNINLFTLTEEQLLESGDMKDKFTLINRNNYFYNIYQIKQRFSTITNEDFDIKISNLSQINDSGKFKKQIDEKIKEIEKIKIKIEDLLKINCFHDNKDCIDITNNKTKKPKDLIKYISNTFGYYDYIERFRKIKITKYVLLQKFQEDEKYYIVSNTCPLDDHECRFFVLNNNLSIYEHRKDSIPIDQIRIIPENHNLYYTNTDRYNLSQGKMLKNDFIIMINKIKKENIPIEYFDLKHIEDILNILYRYDNKINEYMPDIIKKYDNIFIFLAYINKIKIIYDAININVEPTEDQFNDIKEQIYYGYNYYLYLSKLDTILDPDKNVDIINTYLRKTKEEVYIEFITDVKNLYTILNNLKIECADNGILVNYILSNFLDKLFKTSGLPLPINKEKILKRLTETEPILKERVSENDEYIYLQTLQPHDQYFNYMSDFDIFTWENVNYEKYSFPNCGENTLFHLFNYLLTHAFNGHEFIFNKMLNIDKLKNIDGSDTLIYNFYRKFKDYDDLIYQYKLKQEIKNEFAAIFYRLTTEPKFYKQDNICEINPSEDNLIKLINIVLGRNFSNIEEFIKYFYPEHKVENIPTYNIEHKIIILDDIYKLSLHFNHSSIEDANPKIKSQSLYEIISQQPVIELTYRNKLALYGKLKNIGSYIIHEIITSNEINIEKKIEIIKKIYIKYLYLQDISNNTPLILAIFNSFDDISKELIELTDNKDYLDIKNNDNNTALRLAVQYNNENIAELLIKRGVDINGEVEQGNTPLLYAIQHNNENIAILLIENGADKNKENNSGFTPLSYAVLHDNENIAKLLIANGSDTNKENNSGNTPLLYAVQNDNENITKLLIENGADKNKENNSGFTPLLYAIQNKSENIAILLLNKGADINIRNKIGELPLEYATRKGLSVVVKKINSMSIKDGSIKEKVDYKKKYLKYKEKYLRLKNNFI